jgi:hypothetical protein
MTFQEMQNAVLTDRFAEAKRADAKRWINHRAGRLWASEPWTFKLGIVTLSASAAATSVSMGTLQRVFSLRDSTVSPDYSGMEAFRPEDFYAYATRTSNVPNGFTVINNTVYFDTPLSSARTFTVVGELKYTQLTSDGSTSPFPEEFHETIVHGARSEGLREENDPTWQGAEEDYRAGVEDMKAAYLTSVRISNAAYPGWP